MYSLLRDNLGGENFFYQVAKNIYMSFKAAKPFALDIQGQYVPSFYLGGMLLAEVEIDAALIELNIALESGSVLISSLRPWITENRILSGKQTKNPDEILSDPRVQELLAGMGVDDKGRGVIRQRAQSLATDIGIE